MNGGDHAPPPIPTRDDGAFILSLLQQPPSTSPAAAPPRYLAGDPAVAAVGPTLPFPPHIWPPQPQPPSTTTNGLAFHHDRFLGFQHNFPIPSQFTGSQPGTGTDLGDYLRSLSHQQPSISSNSSAPIQGYAQQNHRLMFGSLPSEIAVAPKGFLSRVDHQFTGQGLSERNRPLNPNSGLNAPPGFPSRPIGGELGVLDETERMKPVNYDLERESLGYGDLIRAQEIGEARSNGLAPPTQLDRTVRLLTVPEVEASMMKPESGSDGVGRTKVIAIDDVAQQLVGSLLIEDELDEKNEKKQRQISREKESRSDSRGAWILNQRRRIEKRSIRCRNDIERLNDGFLVIVSSLIPPEEEKFKQQHLLAQLQRLVSSEWPKARLCLYGSCANSFGVSRSDVDLCLAMEETDINKAEVLLKLADMLESDNLDNVQALTRARVPIVKLQDPATGLSCDICINNILAVENTKLLRDYARIDVRLRQLAYVVKHWAKSRGVNETYHGTLSSYAYVVMCIHYLQMRRPAILPCLQGMRPTYSVSVDTVECTYFDQIEKLHNFGSNNKETIAELVWGFFGYWAYVHDYTDSVISIRTGSIISKRDKDWTRRVGNDRHLICIEDPFETSHDLGRVVDKYSIRVLREEFERAAEIMQYDRNPCVKLFERYIPG